MWPGRHRSALHQRAGARQAQCGAGQGAGRAGGVGPAPAAGRGGRMIERLEVELFGQPVGTLAISGPLRSPEAWTFAYRRDYLQSGAPALSVTMPLREAPWVGAVARNWFCNLLPEGDRKSVVSGKSVSVRVDRGGRGSI